MRVKDQGIKGALDSRSMGSRGWRIMGYGHHAVLLPRSLGVGSRNPINLSLTIFAHTKPKHPLIL